MIEVATALLFDADGKLLIYLRDDKPNIPFPNYWDLFGGHIEDGESPEVALIREVQEELGICVTDISFFKIYNCIEGDVNPNRKHVFEVKTEKKSSELTLYEGQYHKAIDLTSRNDYKFANILGTILDEFASASNVSTS